MTPPPPIPEPGATLTQAEATTTTTRVEPPPSWLYRNLRPVILLLLVSDLLYLSYLDAPHARESVALLTIGLVNQIFGERSALKTPGKDAS